MARVVELTGGEGYVNDGERRVVEALAAGLPDSVVIYPNVQVVSQKWVDDVDAIVVTPDVVMAIEIKDLAGRVHVDDQYMLVDSDQRMNPFVVTNFKARRIKGKLDEHPALRSARVHPLVVLAREPKMFTCVDGMKHRVVLVREAIDRLTPPSTEVRQPGLIDGKQDAVAKALKLAPRENVRKVGQYRTDRVVERSATEEVYEAHHELTGRKVRLRRLVFPPSAPKQEVETRRNAALRAVKVASQLDDAAHLIEPGEVFQTDDGSLVVTSPLNELVSLAEWAAGRDLTEHDRRRILSEVADGVATLHRAEVVHGRLSPEAVRVTPGGLAKVGMLGSARLPGSSGRTVLMPDLDPMFAAPESLDDSGVTAAVDLFALGKLIAWLWPDADRPDAPAPAGPAPVRLAEAAASLTVAPPAERRPSAAELSLLALVPPDLVLPDPMPDPVGREPGMVIDSFELIGIVPGAPDNVWHAHDRATDMDCVVKFMPGEGGMVSARNQYQLLKDLSDPCVVTVRHVGVRKDEALLVTELLDGTDLATCLRSGRRFERDEALDLADGLLGALEAVHGTPGNPAHGDVKPANLVLADDRLVLVDLDLAVPPGSTQVGGSPEYLPPDVDFAGDPRDRDLYAAGLVLHELLVGVRPVVGPDGPVVDASIDGPVAEFVARAVAPSQADRFESAEQMHRALDTARRRLAGWQVGDLVVEPVEHLELRDVVPMGGGDRIPLASCDRFRVTLPDGGELVVDVVRGPDGTGWVHTSSTSGVGPVLERLEHGLRMGINRDPSLGLWAELRQARLEPARGPHWSNLFKATLEELDEGAGLDVAALINETCGGQVGERSAILGDSGPRRRYVCATFPDESARGPLAAYLATRVPLLWRPATPDHQEVRQ
jgi:serine/threonine protein kinase